MRTQRKVPAGPKAQPGGKGKGAASSTRQSKAVGINPADPSYGITNTTKRHTSPVSQPTSFNTPSGQRLLSGKAKRQVG